jgi:hypothetical protein
VRRNTHARRCPRSSARGNNPLNHRPASGAPNRRLTHICDHSTAQPRCSCPSAFACSARDGGDVIGRDQAGRIVSQLAVGDWTALQDHEDEAEHRPVVLPASGIDVLRDHKATQAEERLVLGLGKSELVFTRVTGEPSSRIASRAGWRAWRRGQGPRTSCPCAACDTATSRTC